VPRAPQPSLRLRNWFYGFAPPEAGTVVLRHRRVYIVPTRLGALFAASVVLLLVGSINYALALGHALTFALAGLGLAAMVQTTRNLALVAVSTGRAPAVFAGETAQFRIYLDNAAHFERPSILVRHVASGVQTIVHLAAGEATQAVLGVPADRRGRLPLGRIMLETRYPLGLFRAWSYVEPAADCIVYPRPSHGPLPPPASLATSGSARASMAGSDDFSGLREYDRTDSPRHIAWKTYAHSDQLMVKQFAGDAAAELRLDWAQLPAGLDVEARLSRLCGWVLAAEAGGARFAMRIPGAEFPPDRGDSHCTACLSALALFGPP